MTSSAPRATPVDAVDVGVGVAMSIAALGHVGSHVLAGRPHDALWICNVVALLAGPAVLLRSPLLAAVCLTWMVPGTIVWLLDAALAGSTILPTSYGAHLGGTAASVYAVRRSGHARWGWLASLGVMGAVLLVSRVALDPSTNVNSMHAIPRGWEAFAIPGLPPRLGFQAFKGAAAVVFALLGHALGRAIGGATGVEGRAEP